MQGEKQASRSFQYVLAQDVTQWPVPWSPEPQEVGRTKHEVGNGHPLNAIASHAAPKAAGTKPQIIL